MDDRLEVLVFYSPQCDRCKDIKRVVREAQTSVGGLCKFVFLNVSKPHVRDFIATKYKVTRIPSIVVNGEIYFVGVPQVKDLVGMLSYLYSHPDGGKGVAG